MKRLLLTSLCLVYGFATAFSQTPAPYQLFGSYVDLDGQLIHEHADQDYAPAKSIKLFVNSHTDYVPGVYYTTEGRSKGLILYTIGGQNFLFKKNEAAVKEKIEPKAGWSLRVGADSFVVANNFALYNSAGVVNKAVKENSILSYLGQTEQYAFFRYNYKSGNENYLVQDLQTKQLTTLPVFRGAFIEMASDIFKANAELVSIIRNKDIDSDEIPQLIRFIQYQEAMQTNKPIAYNASWEITQDPKQQQYYAMVSKPEKHWKLDFYTRSGEKIFTEHYAYEQPTKNDGEAMWYYLGSDQIRKKANFKKGKMDPGIAIYHPNGTLHYNYLTDPNGYIVYRSILSPDGNSVLDKSGQGKEEYFEASSGRTIIREYKESKLKASYYHDQQQDRKIYQFAQRNVKIKSLQTLNLNLAEEVKYPPSAIKAGEEGIVLVRVLVGPNDKIEQISLVSGVSNRLDNQAVGMLSGQRMDLSLKSGKHGKDEIYQEVIVPVQFSLSRQSINRYHYYNPLWMHQHIYQPAFVPPAAPAMQRF